MFKQKNLLVFVLFLFAIFTFTGCKENDNRIDEVFDELFLNVDLAAVESDLTFPKSVKDVEITYVSNKPEIISNEGEVLRGIRDEVVTVDITLKYREEEVKRKVILVVLKDHNLLIEDVYNSLFSGLDNLETDKNLEFPEIKDGVKISYQSENEGIVTNSGVVTRDLEDREVNVNITLESDNKKVNKILKIKVLKDETLHLNNIYNELFKDVDLSNITNNLDFKTIIDGVSIKYESTNLNVITNDGKISRSFEDKEVDINITLTYGDLEVKKVLKVKVLKDDNLFVNHIYDELFKDINLTRVTNDLVFNTLVNEVYISYKSNNSNVIDNSGKITRGTFDEAASIKVVLTYNNVTLEKLVNIIVLKDANLFINYIYDNLYKDIDLNRLTTNLKLITAKDGVIISYDSLNKSVISNLGVITRGPEDVNVKVNVTLTYDNLIITKELNVTVLKQEDVTYPIINAVNASLNQSVTVQGIVIGIVGSNYYIHDGFDGIYLYLLGPGYSIGDEVRVTGIKTVFNGLLELKDNADVKLIRSGVSLPPATTVERLNEITKQSSLYNIGDLVVVDFDSFRSGRDIFIKLKDSANNTMEIIISKHTSSTDFNQIQNKLFHMSIGDKLHLENVVSSYYNVFQLQVFSADQVTLEFDDGEITTKPIDPYYPRPEDMRFLVDELDEFLTSGVNPIGQANVLIIPVNFTDYKFTNDDLSRLDKAFFGTSEETGWESVKSYYEKTSYCKFSFNGQILAPFQAPKASTYYANLFNKGIDSDYEIIKAALDYYDAEIDYSLYDNNNDGYIDGLYFIYATPTWYGEETGAINDSDLWWAYVYQYYTEEYELYDGVEANYYLWAGVDFMYEAFTYDEYTDYYIDINAATYIHETGHMLGLYDYYDYDVEVGPYGGLGGADMMDYTVGDHNSFSKIMLNWVTPLVVSGKSTTVTIESFTSSGDVILVSTNWNNSYFDEYFLIELYTPTGLNEAHAGFNGLFSTTGVRIFHVNAQVNPDQSDGNLFLYDNSYTELKILNPIEADGNNSIEEYGIAEDSDLYYPGNVFGRDSNYRLANGALVNFNIKIVSINNNSATIEIEWIG